MNGHRRPSQKKRILALLEEAGARGVRSNEFLAEHLPRFSARIFELRHEGYRITSKPDPQSASGMVYTLHQNYQGGPVQPERKPKKRSVEERLLALVARLDARVQVVCRPRPAAPETRWTISTAREGQYPAPGDVWIGETLDEALTRAETR